VRRPHHGGSRDRLTFETVANALAFSCEALLRPPRNQAMRKYRVAAEAFRASTAARLG